MCDFPSLFYHLPLDDDILVLFLVTLMPKYHFSVYSTVQKNAIFLGRCEIETAIYWNIQKYIEMLDFSEYQWLSHPA